VSECCGDIPDEILKDKVVGSPHLSGRDNPGSGEGTKTGIVAKLGACFSSVRSHSYFIYPVVLILSVFLLFFLRKGGKD